MGGGWRNQGPFLHLCFLLPCAWSDECLWKEDAGAGACGDSPAMAEKASASVQSLTKALRVAERKQAMTPPAASLPNGRLRQPLSLSMSLTAHSPCFFRKLFFPFSLSMETQNSNQKGKKRKEKKNNQPSSLRACKTIPRQCPDREAWGR